MTPLLVAAAAVAIGAGLLALDVDAIRARVVGRVGSGPTSRVVPAGLMVLATVGAIGVRAYYARQGLPYAWFPGEERLVDGWIGAPIDGWVANPAEWRVARGVAAAVAVLQVGVAAWLATRLAGPWAGAVAALVLAVYGPGVALAVIATPTGPAVVLTLCAAACLHAATRGAWTWAAAGGVALTAAIALDVRAAALAATLPALPLLRREPPADRAWDALWILVPTGWWWGATGAGAFAVPLAAVACGVLATRVARLGEGTWGPAGGWLTATGLATGVALLAGITVADGPAATTDTRSALPALAHAYPDALLGVVDELGVHPDDRAKLPDAVTGPARALLCDGTLDRVAVPPWFVSEQHPAAARTLTALLPSTAAGRPVDLDAPTPNPGVRLVRSHPLPPGCLSVLGTASLFGDPLAAPPTAVDAALRFVEPPWIRTPQIRLPAGTYAVHLEARADAPVELHAVVWARARPVALETVTIDTAFAPIALVFVLPRSGAAGLELAPPVDAPTAGWLEVRGLTFRASR